MSPLYPYPAVLPPEVYIGPFVGLLILAFIYVAYKKDWRPYLFGFLFFLFNVMFLLQVVGAGQGFLADRFTYIPYMGLIFIVVFAGQQLYESKVSARKFILYGFAAYLLVFFVLTWKQNQIWRNSDVLWTHVLKYHTNTSLPYRNRANYRRDQGRIDEALADYNAAISLKPDAALYNSRAKLYFNQQKYQEAMSDYNRAIALDSSSGEYFINRGAVYALTGNFQPALQDFNKGLALSPEHANGYKNRSLVYQALQRWDDAYRDVEKYLTMHPEDADLWYEKGRLNNIRSKYQEGLQDLNRAIQLNPQQGLFYYEKMKALLALGQKAQALQLLQTVQKFGVQIEPQVQAALSQ